MRLKTLKRACVPLHLPISWLFWIQAAPMEQWSWLVLVVRKLPWLTTGRALASKKNRAIALSHGRWVLSLDADEKVTPELKAEIIAALQAPTADVYAIGRLSKYCGQYMHHSGWYPDPVTRLFCRGSAHFTDDLVHEKLMTKKSVGKLSGLILHESFKDFESVLEKINRYSSAGAEMAILKGKKSSVTKAVTRGVWAFFRTYILRLGFLDGQMGLVLAISNGEGTYYRYLKIWLSQNNLKKSGRHHED